jgi:hypothetical protein
VSKFKIDWLDSGREPKVAPNPDYPNGKDVGYGPCKVDLPYPAKRVGMYIVHCNECGNTTAVTTAGRPDDPRSVGMECLKTLH